LFFIPSPRSGQPRTPRNSLCGIAHTALDLAASIGYTASLELFERSTGYMTEQDKTSKGAVRGAGSGRPDGAIQQRALILELEYVAADMHQFLYEDLSRRLKAAGAELGAEEFSRLLFTQPLEELIVALPKRLKADTLDGQELLNTVKHAIDEACAGGKIPLRTEILPLLDYATGQGFTVIAVTALKQGSARALIAKTALAQRAMELFTFSGETKAAAGADVWLQVSKKYGLQPRRCLAMTGSSETCKAALTAGMCCIAVPDAFTGFQDFSGADLILDDLKAVDPVDVFRSVCS